MGDKIGDYVHSHIRGYLKYGISEPNPELENYVSGRDYNYKTAKEKLVNKLRKTNYGKLNSNEIKDIEGYFNSFLQNRTIDNKEVEGAFKELENKLKNISLKLGNNIIQQLNKVTESGNVENLLLYNNQKIEIERTKIENAIAQNKNGQLRFKTVQTQYQNTLKAITTQLKKSQSGTTNEALMKLRNKMYTSMENIKKTYKYIKKGKEGYHLINKDDTNVQNIMNITSMLSNLPNADFLGNIGEYTLLCSVIGALGKTSNNLNDILIKAIKNQKIELSNGISISMLGDKTIERKFDYNKFAKNTKITGIEGSGLITLDHDGTGKVDLEIKKPDNTKINFSVKNANLSFGRSVTMGTYSSLLLALQHIDGEFVNHWLNVTSSHKAAKTRFGKYENSLSPTTYQDAHDAMKIALVGLCLVGFNKEIDYLVVNNNTRKKHAGDVVIKIIPVSQILDSFFNMDLKNIKHSVSVKVGRKNNLLSIASDKQLWKNEWVGDEKIPNMDDARKRINNLLSEMHGLNLEASLRPTFLLKEMGNNIDSKAYYASIKTK